MISATKAFAPAKINLTLHVTGQRDDGYHLLDSLVMFADRVGDRICVNPSDEISLTVSGPMAQCVPLDQRNLCWKAVELFGTTAAVHLEKHLPSEAGIGGGSSDAAAVLRALSSMTGRVVGFDTSLLGADVPVCCHANSARMSGIGEVIEPVAVPSLPVILINPRVSVPTPRVFQALDNKANAPMPEIPHFENAWGFVRWLSEQRNDLEPPAMAVQPVIAEVLSALAGCNADLVRMSGSGATCFGIFLDRDLHEVAAKELRAAHPEWWIQDTHLI